VSRPGPGDEVRRRLLNPRVALRAKTWSANERVQAHEFVAGGEMRLELVEQFIRELGQRYRVCEIAYDPTFSPARRSCSKTRASALSSSWRPATR